MTYVNVKSPSSLCGTHTGRNVNTVTRRLFGRRAELQAIKSHTSDPAERRYQVVKHNWSIKQRCYIDCDVLGEVVVYDDV